MSENKKDFLPYTKDGNLYVFELNGKSYGFKKLTWGEKNRVMKISQTITHDGQLQFDMAEFNTNLVLATLKKAPFAISKQSINEYPDSKLMDNVLSIATQMNIADPIKIQNL